ncbi:MAG: efflux RND transporter periplasmic adaptor subunit [Desulfuromonadales bacterium]|nr:efflux RND transporter periplasmic adaptor subunit [Desulfuromonadales bacterium]
MILLRHLTLSLCVLVVLAVLCPPVWSAGVEAITKPSADILLSFIRGGRVSEILVKEGVRVRQGHVLARQEDLAERIQLRQLQEKADDNTRIKMVEVELAQKKEDLKRMEWAKQEGAATEWEIEHARLEVETAELSRRLAVFERNQAQLQRDELSARIEQLSLYSPVSGQVEEVVIEIGEAAEPLSPVVRVVKIDPLWIDVQVPLEKARALKENQLVEVDFGSTGTEKLKGRLQNIAAVADAASDTLRVRVEVPNPSRRPAGERVKVLF